MRIMELFEAQTGFQLYVDMDGVLVDFVGGASKMMGDPSFKLDSKSNKTEFWKMLHAMDPEELEMAWANFGWAPGGQEFWKFVSKFKPIILSSPGTNSREIIERGKSAWIKKNLNPSPAGVIFTKDKFKHSGKFNILIDDMNKNTIPWEEHGGNAILYKTGDSKSAIKELITRFGFPRK